MLFRIPLFTAFSFFTTPPRRNLHWNLLGLFKWQFRLLFFNWRLLLFQNWLGLNYLGNFLFLLTTFFTDREKRFLIFLFYLRWNSNFAFLLCFYLLVIVFSHTVLKIILQTKFNFWLFLNNCFTLSHHLVQHKIVFFWTSCWLNLNLFCMLLWLLNTLRRQLHASFKNEVDEKFFT